MAFKQRVPGISLSLEQGTEAVPDDHRYHLLHAGSEIASFKQEAQALRSYRAERDRLLAEARVPERAGGSWGGRNTSHEDTEHLAWSVI